MTETSAIRTSTALSAQNEATFDAFDLSSAADVVADGLKAHHFDVRVPTSERCSYLKVTNVQSSVTDLTICQNGFVAWEYQCLDGHPHDPDRIAGIALDILDANESPNHPDRLVPLPCMTFLGRIGLAAIAHDMRVAFGSLDPVNAQLQVHDELTVTNPGLPRRGTVRITRDGAVRWQCRIRNQPHGRDGLGLTQITGIVALALTSAQLGLRERDPRGPAARPGSADSVRPLYLDRQLHGRL